MESNILEINHSKLGVEKFKITTPTYNVYTSEDGTWEFTIHFTTSETIHRVKELEEVIDAAPYIEATSVLSKEEIPFKKGTRIFQKHGYDYDRDENLSILYYFAYNAIENLTIQILEIGKDEITINMKGDTIVNGSNGNHPDAEITLHNTKFLLDKKLQRSFS